MNQKLITKIVVCIGVVPATLVSLPFLIIGVLSWPIITDVAISQGAVFQVALDPGEYSITEMIPVTVPLGAWGLCTLWALAVHYLNSDDMPPRVVLKILGLCAGFVAALQVIVNSLGQHDREGQWLLEYPLILSIFSGLYFLFLVFASGRKGATGEPNQMSDRGAD